MLDRAVLVSCFIAAVVACVAITGYVWLVDRLLGMLMCFIMLVGTAAVLGVVCLLHGELREVIQAVRVTRRVGDAMTGSPSHPHLAAVVDRRRTGTNAG